MKRLHPFILLLLLLGAQTVKAQNQHLTKEEPGFLRMCLWNADKGTWSHVGLNKKQVRQMIELKGKYPAVVDGQWIWDDPVQQHGSSAGGAVAPNGKAPSTHDVATGTGLVEELRLVLTEKQMHRWMTLCKAGTGQDAGFIYGQ